jgi:hypothetical protein
MLWPHLKKNQMIQQLRDKMTVKRYNKLLQQPRRRKNVAKVSTNVSAIKGNRKNSCMHMIHL